MAIPRVEASEYGYYLKINTKIDLTGYTELEMRFEKPDGATISKKTADGVEVDGQATGGIIRWLIPQSFHNINGIWKVAPIITFASSISVGKPSARYSVKGVFDE